MAAAADIVTPPKRSFDMEKIVDFSPESLKAPFFLRLGALLIDYMLLVCVPLVWLIAARMFGDAGTNLAVGATGWTITAILGIANLLVFPLVRGKTVGKALTGQTIVRMDGTPATVGNILLRNVVGYLLSAATLGLGFLIAAVNSSGRALHDFVGGTIVVRGNKRRAL